MNCKPSLCASVVLFLFSALLVPARDNRPFNFYTVSEGLPNASVGYCCQDAFGRIWLGTKNGICHFDGSDFQELDGSIYPESLDGSIIAMASDGSNLIWFASSGGFGCIDVYSDEIRRIDNIPYERVSSIKIDADGNIWLSFPNRVCHYDVRSGSINHTLSIESRCNDIALTDDGRLLFVPSDGTVAAYDKATGNMKPFRILSPKELSEGIVIEHIASGRRGCAVVSTSDCSVFELELETAACRKLYAAPRQDNASIITCIACVGDEYWVGTADGIHVIDMSQDTYEYLAFNRDEQDAYSGDNIRCIFPDRFGNVWVGTNGGLIQYMNDESSFKSYVSGPSPGSISGQTIRTIVPDGEGRIWIGSEEGEICRFDPETDIFERFTARIKLARGTSVTGMLFDNGRLWVATYGNGLLRYDLDSDSIGNCSGELPDYCLGIIKTRSGRVYLAAADGLYVFSRDADTFLRIDAVGRQFVHAVLEDRLSRLWIGTYGNGLGLMAPESGDYVQITAADEETGLKSNYISSLFEDSRGNIWATTDGAGIARLRPGDDGGPQVAVDHFTFEDGLPTNNTCAVTEDRNGKLWVTTSNGLALFNPESWNVEKTYMQSNPILGGNFVYGACYRSPEGTVYMGTSKGLAAFNLEKLSGNTNVTPLMITDIHTVRGGKYVPLREEGRSVAMTRSIKVRYKDLPYISFSFSPLDFSPLKQYEYEYSLKGYKRNSVVVTSNNTATYTDLPPGKYRFTVRLLPCSSNEESCTVDLTVTPPWYQSFPALLVYSCLFAVAAVLAVRLRERRRKEEEDRRIASLEASKQKELYDAKINYFTNITHEVRTPLTLIKIPLEKILSGDGVPEKWRSDLLMIQANTNRLLKLSNRLLDLGKLEVMESRLNFAETDILAVVKHCCSLFKAAVDEQGAVLNLSLPEAPLVMSCNEEAVESILCNLISNALKHCIKVIKVVLSSKDDTLVIRVSNDGPRIPEKEKEKIFGAFYQAEDGSLDRRANGTGLGLTYARSLARLHAGQLYLDTDVPGYNEFVLELPLHHEADIKDAGITDVEEELPREDMEQERDTSRHNVLIVEDDREMRAMLGRELSSEYNILLAANGREALELTETHRVDMIISDIMMPVKDGCQLCNEIKSNLETSHIPVILLTAAIGIETHIRTLRVGADSYIEKPFSMDLLRESIASLFRNREIAYQQYSSAPLQHFGSLSFSKVDRDFMTRFHSVVMERLSDTELSTETVSKEMSMSKATLYRKVKATTGMSVSEYIRLCRMKKAAELLVSNQYRINEVAYIVGYSTSSYFAENFQKQYGVTPSEFRKSLKTKENP